MREKYKSEPFSLKSFRFGAVAFALSALSVTSPVTAQSPYELRLGMHKSVVERVLGGNLGNLDTELSDGRDQWFRSQSIDLVFCENKLTAFRIALTGDLASWATAVETAKAERGPPEMSWQGSIFGEIEAKWRVAPYQFLSISMVQYRNGDIEVDRWMSDLRKCDTPLSL